jgi:proteic killer suppression protein
MEIRFDSNRVRRLCQRAQGKLKRRLDDIQAAENFATLLTISGQCHPLRGNRSGQWAIHIEEPNRLIFEPFGDPLPKTPDGHPDLEKVTSILIIEIVDYHE